MLIYYCLGDERVNLDELIENNKELIYSIIYRFKTYEVDDLFQVGCVGLIKAFNNYCADYDTKFTTYAYPYIVGEIYQYINSNHTIKLSRDSAKLKSGIRKAEEYLTQQLCRVPTDLEIANFLEIDLSKLQELRNLEYLESLDYVYDDNSDMYKFINVNGLDKETLIDLKNAFSALNEEERELIVKLYFYNMTQEMVARQLNINQVRVSRVLKKTLFKMRTYMN